jgi:hypothetical protein
MSKGSRPRNNFSREFWENYPAINWQRKFVSDFFYGKNTRSKAYRKLKPIQTMAPEKALGFRFKGKGVIKMAKGKKGKKDKKSCKC